jgi:2-C-methyl-D-erythritol 4-phosphate cytidylyltransferase
MEEDCLVNSSCMGAVILAAGSGTRFGGLKQDVVFGGKPLWRYPYDLAVEMLPTQNVVVVGKDVEGGATRSASVINGLAALPENVTRVVILEAARPLVTKKQIAELLDHDADSVTFVRPLVNTVIGRDGTYYDRNSMYELLVPQAFDCRKLIEAYRSGEYGDMTDETRVMFEHYGIKPAFVQGGENLFKVTYSNDISVIECIADRESAGEKRIV